MAHDQEVTSSKPDTVYWMGVRDLLAIILKIKEAKWGTPKNYFKKLRLFCFSLLACFYYGLDSRHLPEWGSNAAHQQFSKPDIFWKLENNLIFKLSLHLIKSFLKFLTTHYSIVHNIVHRTLITTLTTLSCGPPTLTLGSMRPKHIHWPYSPPKPVWV
jgi:hypothetical protein